MCTPNWNSDILSIQTYFGDTVQRTSEQKHIFLKHITPKLLDHLNDITPYIYIPTARFTHIHPTMHVKNEQWAMCFTPGQLNTDQITKQNLRLKG